MSSTALKVYGPDEVQIAFGPIAIRGYADGEFVKIEMNDDAFKLVTGTDGESTRSKTSNRGAKITVTLMQSSDTNGFLSAVHELDKSTPGGPGILPLIVKDSSGTSLYTAPKAWIVKAPTVAFGREPGPREWIFETNAIIRFDGGN